MASNVSGYEYDIFISYRHNDNLDGWVSEFVASLDRELKSTLKNPPSIYFDRNPQDGLLETHQVASSLKVKLKCLIFIPIISQTYCDKKSFAWQHEFCSFHQASKDDQFGRDIRLANGNVSSRILPVKIHELDAEDKYALEQELNGPLRAIEFVYSEPGVNRPLRPSDSRNQNLHRTDFKNQINKTANAIKELITALQGKSMSHQGPVAPPAGRNKKRPAVLIGILILSMLLAGTVIFLTKRNNTIGIDKTTETLDRADQYLEEAGRFDDKRYVFNAIEATRKVLAQYPSNERALYLLAIAIDNRDTTDSFVRKLNELNANGVYGYLLQAVQQFQRRDFVQAVRLLDKAVEIDPLNKDALQSLSFANLILKDYVKAWTYAKRFEGIQGKGIHNVLSSIYLELGDFKEARIQLEKKKVVEEFSCGDIESYQRIFLCEGSFERLEHVTDSICALTKCEQCPFWRLRAKMHVGKFDEASRLVRAALNENNKLSWRYPAFVLYRVGKNDSAGIIMQAEFNLDKERLADTSYHQAIPLYSLSAISAMQGNFEESLKKLRQYSDRGFEMGSEWYISHDPLFDEMQKNNAHFADFIQIVQKAQSQKSAIRERLREVELNYQ
jgi:tetratricopeptide (TPR) repeat protein